ncbi:hypothetical protein HK097_010967 [Rhizophlyctis rosea]|uniref:Uncharacterized protein n=1 Tax=Rhizophlyctis rosea TaxID=64517 RepID=A0AAD5X271_9FUNG|nr:hypothetical protein HK097_010967 [Rhizophlyctis rosea]
MLNLLSPFKTLGKKISNFLTFICCLGPVLVIVGIVFLASAGTKSRENKIEQYNAAVEAWSTNYRNDLAAASFSLSSPVSAPLGEQTYPSSGMQLVKDNDQSQLHDYTPLYYASSTNSIPYSSDGKYFVQTTDRNGVTQSFTLNHPKKLTKTVTQNTMNCRTSSECNIRTQTDDQYRTCTSRPYCSTVCTNTYGGTLTTSTTCSYDSVLRSICVQISNPSSGSGYRVATATALTNNQVGCDYSNGFEPAVYEPESKVGLAASFTTLKGITLRHSADPYITLQAITSGTMAFGLSTGQKTATGVIFLVVGIAWMVFLCFVIFLIVKCLARTVETAAGKVSDLPTSAPMPVVTTVAVQEFQVPIQQYPQYPQQQQQQQYVQQQPQQYPQQPQQQYMQPGPVYGPSNPIPPSPGNQSGYYPQPSAPPSPQPYGPYPTSVTVTTQPVNNWPQQQGGSYNAWQGQQQQPLQQVQQQGYPQYGNRELGGEGSEEAAPPQYSTMERKA